MTRPRASKFFTPTADAFLRARYAELGVQRCAARLGRTPDQVYARAYRLGLVNTPGAWERGRSASRTAPQFDDRALAAALGVPDTPPDIPAPSRVLVHRCEGA